MTSVKKIKKIIEKIGANPFGCDPGKVSWKSYRFSSNQRESGALTGEFFNKETGEKLYSSDYTLTELLEAGEICIEDFNPPLSYEQTIEIRSKYKDKVK